MEVDKNSESDNIQLQENPDPKSSPLPENDTNTETTLSDSFVLSESSILEDNQESSDIGTDDNSDQTNLNISRELKLLLALSKEANLKTNISHKRKKDVKDFHRGNSSDIELRKSVKVASETKQNIRFPVTAEAELEDDNDSKSQNEVSKSTRKKRDTSSESRDGTVSDDRKTKKNIHGDIKLFKPNKDAFCWRCHREGVNVVCETCPRAYHQKCLKQTIMDANHWPCPECVAILRAESTQTRSPAMKGMTLEHLCSLLKFALNRMIQCQGSEPFLHPVSEDEFPDYRKYIIQPMDLTMLEKNIKENLYGSTQAFEADAKWLLHNSIIYNSYQSKLTSAVKSMIKICKQEMMEIENCPSCYLKANVNKATWFVEVCPKPHIIVWAKLKGFPYWPAKAMSVSSTGMVDVRFFGAHDRAWVHWRECFLYSERDPNTFKQKRFDIEKSVEELNIYTDNLKKVYGEFRYAPFRTPLDPDNMSKQLLIFLPKYKSIVARRKSIRESSETKSEDSIDTKSESVAKEEPTDDIEKSESSRSDSNITSPVPDNDTTMEGYGTDEDMQPSIDLESRKAFTGKKVVEREVTEDDEDLDDTQVPSNVSVDRFSRRSKVKTRSVSGKLRVVPRLSSDNRRSSDEILTPQKMSRRNSDQSVKSDSSRVSNISEKINKVVMSENMEITLGNEDVGCVSISENISPTNGEHSRSGSEHSFEIKKKPIQVDINNAEFSISPSKLKISEQLMKRLSDVQKVQGTKKCLVDENNSIEEHSKPSTSTPKKVNGGVDGKTQNVSEDAVQKNNRLKLFEAKETPSSKETEEVPKNVKIVQPLIRKFMTVKQKSAEVDSNKMEKKIRSGPIDIENKESEPMEVDSTESKTTIADQEVSPIVVVSLEKDVDLEEMNAATKDSELPETKDSELPETKDSEPPKTKDSESPKTKDSEPLKTKDLHQVQDQSSRLENVTLEQDAIMTSRQTKELVNPQETTHSKNNVSSEENSVVESSLENATGKQHKDSDDLVTHQNDEEDTSSEKVTKTNKVKEKASHHAIALQETNDILEKDVTSNNSGPISCNVTIADYEEDESDTNDSLFDKKAIFDVIHSSLKTAKNLAMNTEEINNVDKEKKTLNKCKETEVFKKRKLPLEETHSPAKLVKLVSIESILSQKDEDVSNTTKEMDKKLQAPLVETNTPEIAPEDIKSEPESEDESMEDVQNMEEKKKYLSALNIHAKTAEMEKKERNEIRTRSKAEEKRERFKVVDNLTRIIDDVALNYSAKHEGEKIPQRKPERRKSGNGFPASEGEIFVKSFARLHNPISAVKQRARKTFPMPVYLKTSQKQPFPKKDVSLLKKDAVQKVPNSTVVNITSQTSTTSENFKSVTTTPSTTVHYSTSTTTVTNQTPLTVGLNPASSNSTSISLVTQTPMGLITPASVSLTTPTSAAISLIHKSSETPISVSHQTMAMGHVILMNTSAVNYCTPLLNACYVIHTPRMKRHIRNCKECPQEVKLLFMGQITYFENYFKTEIVDNNSDHEYDVPEVKREVGPPTPALTACPISTQPQQFPKKAAPIIVPNLRTSQNYIPHNDNDDDDDSGRVSPSTTNNALNDILNQLPTTPQTMQQRLSEVPELVATSNSNEVVPVSSLNPTTSLSSATNDTVDEFAVLNGLIPESVSRAVCELLLRPPPRLKPRPPGITSQVFEEGIPSTAGDVTARINSVSHRMSDYFRGMLIETLEDLGKTINPEAKIASLQLELETLKHRHNLEMAEVRKNMCSILKDIQRSIVEERNKIVDETRASCEAETIRRVEIAKSKQWCANCPKEAQFYCCWNTSYCDYPCQQKHWPQHASKCTQSIEKATGAGSAPPPRTAGQPIVLRPAAPPKSGMGRIIAKPAKVYMNRTSTSQKNVKAVPTSGLTLVETTPGNYELVGNGSIGLTGKIFTTSAAINTSKSKGTPSTTIGTPKLSTVTSDTPRPTSSGVNRPQHM